MANNCLWRRNDSPVPKSPTLILELPLFWLKTFPYKVCTNVSFPLAVTRQKRKAWKWLAGRCQGWLHSLALSAGCSVVLNNSSCASDFISKVSRRSLLSRKCPAWEPFMMRLQTGKVALAPGTGFVRWSSWGCYLYSFPQAGVCWHSHSARPWEDTKINLGADARAQWPSWLVVFCFNTCESQTTVWALGLSQEREAVLDTSLPCRDAEENLSLCTWHLEKGFSGSAKDPSSGFSGPLLAHVCLKQILLLNP